MDSGRADHWYKQEEDEDDSPSVSMRIDVRAAALGLPEVPVGMHLSPLPSEGGQWAVHVRTWPGKAEQAGAWLQKWKPVEAVQEKGLSPDNVRLRFAHMPSPWDRFVGQARIDHMCLSDVGVLSFVVEDDEESIAHFLEHLQGEAGETERVRIRKIHKRLYPLTDLLTPQQLDAVFAAESLGYYDDSRRLSLRDLARQTDRSVAATSQLIRRAEARIVQACVDMLTASCGIGEDAGHEAGRCPCAGRP